MNRQEAAREIDNIACCFSDNRIRNAMHMGAAALRGWVKTSDGLPTREDANKDLRVLAKVANDGTVKEVRFEELSWIELGGAYYFSHWMKLPEVVG